MILNLTHDDAWGEGPVDAGGANLERRRLADLPHKLHIPRGSEAYVVGEDGGSKDVVVPVDGIGAIEDGDGEPGREGEALRVVDHAGPVGRRGAVAGRAVAAVQHAAGAELRESAGRSIWAIWPAFSRNVMRPSRSRTRAYTGADASLNSSTFVRTGCWTDSPCSVNQRLRC